MTATEIKPETAQDGPGKPPPVPPVTQCPSPSQAAQSRPPKFLSW